MLDLAIAFVISNVWTIGFLIAAIYNYCYRPEHKPITHFALFASVIFAFAHITYSQWLAYLYEPVKVHYLYLAISTLVLTLLAYFYNKIRGFVFHWQIKLAIGLLLLELALTLMVHVDRNVVALNASTAINYGRDKAWWLWDIRTILSHLNNVIILTSLFLPVGLFTRSNLSPDEQDIAFTGNYAHADNVVPIAPHQFENQVRLTTCDGFRTLTSETYIKEVDQAYNRVEAIQDLIRAMPEGKSKTTALQFAFTASELITEQDQSKVDYIQSITLLCDRARDLALYTHPPSTKKNVGLPNQLEQHI